MQIKNGDIIEGKISGITKYGAFVSAGEITGMIHISEITGDFVKDINEVLKVGQEVRAVVLKVNGDGRLALSIKQLAGEKTPAAAAAPSLQKRAEESNTEKSKDSFEDMMNKFKRESDEKISGLKYLEPKTKRSGQAKVRRRKD